MGSTAAAGDVTSGLWFASVIVALASGEINVLWVGSTAAAGGATFGFDSHQL